MSKTKQNARLLADAERRLSQTGNDITVVRVERYHGSPWMFVEFSERVHLQGHKYRSSEWLVEDERGHLAMGVDELAAYLWGLKVIEEHKERINGQR